jgi:hypothetical protein
LAIFAIEDADFDQDLLHHRRSDPSLAVASNAKRRVCNERTQLYLYSI